MEVLEIKKFLFLERVSAWVYFMRKKPELPSKYTTEIEVIFFLFIIKRGAIYIHKVLLFPAIHFTYTP